MHDNDNIKRARSPWSWVPTLYFAEGIPYVVVMTVALVLYKQLGLNNAQITLYTSWLYLPWVIKPLWSPIVDILRTKRWWIVSMQMVISIAFAGVAFTLPCEAFWLQATLACFWLLAFASATHDIAADGFYMLGLNDSAQATFVGIRSTFYRVATIFGQGFIVMLAGWLQTLYAVNSAWIIVFAVLELLFLMLTAWHAQVLPRVESSNAEGDKTADDGYNARFNWREQEICSSFCHIIIEFFKKEQAAVAILFMLLYRMPEGLLAKVSALFLLDPIEVGGLGLTTAEYGFAQGTVGVIGLTLGGILGGVLAGRDGLKRWLWWMVAAITLPDLVYIYLSTTLPTSLLIINTCIFIEQFGYGFGFTAYMLYLIHYSRGSFQTSHYALCTAFMALSMMIPGLFAGALQEAIGYPLFFSVVCALCSVTFIITRFIKL